MSTCKRCGERQAAICVRCSDEISDGGCSLAAPSGSAFTVSDAINGLKHLADDHECCRTFVEASIKVITERVRMADRLADYVRMYHEANPPMPDAIEIAWRDYQAERNSQNA